MQGWGGSCRGGESYRCGVGWVMQGWDGVSHSGVGWDGSFRGEVGWVIQGWGVVGDVGVGWGVSCRGGVCDVGVSGCGG